MKQLMLWLSMFTLLALSCGMPVNTQPASETSTNVSYPSITPAPVPKVIQVERQTVCGFWNVRSAANASSASIGIVLSGNTVTLTGREATAIDGGTWVQVEGRDGAGWMNKKGLCNE